MALTRIRTALITGTLSAPLTDVAVTMESDALADLPAVAPGEVAVLVLDPTAPNGESECVYVTAHDADATTATIVRGQEQAVGFGPARSHTSTTRWHLAPTPRDYDWGDASATIAIPTDDLTIIPLDTDGRIAKRIAVVSDTTGEPCSEWPDPADHLYERVAIVSAPGAASAGAWWKSDTPTPGTASIGGVFVALFTAIGEGNSVDLTYATLGYNFLSRAKVNGVEYVSDPLDDVYGPVTAGDGYAELSRLLVDLLAPFLANGVTIDVGTGVLSTDTVGAGSSIAFHPAQEPIAGVDLVAVLADGNPFADAAPAAAGKDGIICGMAAGRHGGLGAATYYDLADYAVAGMGTHLHENVASDAHRSWEFIAVPCETLQGITLANGAAWVPFGNGATRDSDILNSYQFGQMLNGFLQAVYADTGPEAAGTRRTVSAFIEPGGSVAVLTRPSGGLVEVIETDDDIALNADVHHDVILTVGGKAATLPALADVAVGTRFTVRNLSGGADCSLDPDGTDTIDGSNTPVAVPDGASVAVQATPSLGWRTL